MEQIVLYLAILAALSGFAMGLLNLAGPFLKRRNITLPSLSIASLLRRSAEDEDDPPDQTLGDAGNLSPDRNSADSDLNASEKSLLARRRQAGDDDEELDEELASVLDEVAVAEPEVAEEEDASGEDTDGTVIYTVPAEVEEQSEAEDEEQEREDKLPVVDRDDVDDEVEDVDDDEIEDVDDDEDEGGEVEDEDEDEDNQLEDDEDEDEDEDEAAGSDVQVVSAGGGEGDDMMSFFDEASDAGRSSVAAWQEDLPQVNIEELLAEARAISQRIKGKKSDAA